MYADHKCRLRGLVLIKNDADRAFDFCVPQCWRSWPWRFWTPWAASFLFLPSSSEFSRHVSVSAFKVIILGVSQSSSLDLPYKEPVRACLPSDSQSCFWWHSFTVFCCVCACVCVLFPPLQPSWLFMLFIWLFNSYSKFFTDRMWAVR